MDSRLDFFDPRHNYFKILRMSCYQFLAAVCLPKIILKKSRVTAVACVLLAQWGKRQQIQINSLFFQFPVTLQLLPTCSQTNIYNIRF